MVVVVVGTVAVMVVVVVVVGTVAVVVVAVVVVVAGVVVVVVAGVVVVEVTSWGGDSATGSVGCEVAICEPAPFVAVTCTLIVKPTSAGIGR